VGRDGSDRRGYGATRLDAMVNRDNPGGETFWTHVGFELDTEDRRWPLTL